MHWNSGGCFGHLFLWRQTPPHNAGIEDTEVAWSEENVRLYRTNKQGLGLTNTGFHICIKITGFWLVRPLQVNACTFYGTWSIAPFMEDYTLCSEGDIVVMDKLPHTVWCRTHERDVVIPLEWCYIIDSCRLCPVGCSHVNTQVLCSCVVTRSASTCECWK